jgi:hypothetical protein
MQKKVLFVLTAPILMAAFATVALYPVNTTAAQAPSAGNATKNSTAGANATNVTGAPAGGFAAAKRNATD